MATHLEVLGVHPVDADGESVAYEHSWTGDVRIAFFFHYFEKEWPLVTPFGDVKLPRETARPARLVFLDYEPP